MLEGIRLVFFRTVQGMFICIGLMPVWNIILAWVYTQNIEFCGESIPYVVLGVQQIPWLIMLSVGIAAIHTYFRAVQKRKYEGVYSQGEIYNVYNK